MPCSPSPQQGVHPILWLLESSWEEGGCRDFQLTVSTTFLMHNMTMKINTLGRSIHDSGQKTTTFHTDTQMDIMIQNTKTPGRSMFSLVEGLPLRFTFDHLVHDRRNKDKYVCFQSDIAATNPMWRTGLRLIREKELHAVYGRVAYTCNTTLFVLSNTRLNVIAESVNIK